MRRQFLALVTILIVGVALGGIYFSVPMIFGSVVVPLPDEYVPIIKANARQFKVDSCLIAAVINGESRWNPNAQSGAGAAGLMQLIGGTADAISAHAGLPYGRNSRKNPEASIAMGTALLQYNIQSYGSLRNALVAYNGGGSRARLPDSALPRETQFYVVKITRYYQLYASTYPDLCTGPSLIGQKITNTAANPGPDFVAPPTDTAPDIQIDTFWKSFLSY
jgi:hypothetical protein